MNLVHAWKVLGMHYEIEFREEDLLQLEKSTVNVAAGLFVNSSTRNSYRYRPFDEFINKLGREGLSGLIMTGNLR